MAIQCPAQSAAKTKLTLVSENFLDILRLVYGSNCYLFGAVDHKCVITCV